MSEPEDLEAPRRPTGDTGELAGRTFLVTGGNTGIGRATAAGLAGRGGHVWIAARSRAKGEAAVAGIKASTQNEAVWFLPLDLADLDSVRACASAFLALGEPLHVLVNNAGVVRARGLTKQGFELMFGVNHLGHFALTNALLGCLTASAPARVVTVSSDSHYSARGIDFEALRRPERGITGLHGYAVSKLCNVLFSQELARRTADTGVTTYALHPGVVASDIWRRVPWPVRPLMTRRMLTVDEGAATSLYCATSPDVAQDSGKFYDKCAERAPSRVATPELAAELWKRSEEWTAAPS
jgi:NAD(P)-dependent dehydrogenase (short-subunit alcohol dehydrogenase family)